MGGRSSSSSLTAHRPVCRGLGPHCICGDMPTDEHVPSLQDKPAKIVLPTPPFNCIPQYGRCVLFCSDCGKPRIIYAQKKLTDSQRDVLDAHLEAGFEYICGKSLFPEGHSLEKVVFQPKQTRCRVAISSQYYRAANVMAMDGWRWVCGVDGCHDASESAIEDDSYSCLPRCIICKEAGKEAPKSRSNTRRGARPTTAASAMISSAGSSNAGNSEDGGEGPVPAPAEPAADTATTEGGGDNEANTDADAEDADAATFAITEADSEDTTTTTRGDVVGVEASSDASQSRGASLSTHPDEEAGGETATSVVEPEPMVETGDNNDGTPQQNGGLTRALTSRTRSRRSSPSLSLSSSSTGGNREIRTRSTRQSSGASNKRGSRRNAKIPQRYWDASLGVDLVAGHRESTGGAPSNSKRRRRK